MGMTHLLTLIMVMTNNRLFLPLRSPSAQLLPHLGSHLDTARQHAGAARRLGQHRHSGPGQRQRESQERVCGARLLLHLLPQVGGGGGALGRMDSWVSALDAAHAAPSTSGMCGAVHICRVIKLWIKNPATQAASLLFASHCAPHCTECLAMWCRWLFKHQTSCMTQW